MRLSTLALKVALFVTLFSSVLAFDQADRRKIIIQGKITNTTPFARSATGQVLMKVCYYPDTTTICPICDCDEDSINVEADGSYIFVSEKGGSRPVIGIGGQIVDTPTFFAGISINNGPELSPRLRISSSMYSLGAEYLKGGAVKTGTNGLAAYWGDFSKSSYSVIMDSAAGTTVMTLRPTLFSPPNRRIDFTAGTTPSMKIVDSVSGTVTQVDNQGMKLYSVVDISDLFAVYSASSLTLRQSSWPKRKATLTPDGLEFMDSTGAVTGLVPNDFNPLVGGSCWQCSGMYTYLTDPTDFVGIGTSTPTAKVDIFGNIKASDKANFGTFNSNAGQYAFVVGTLNSAAGMRSTIGGGMIDTALGTDNVIAGGQYNKTSGLVSTVGGGGHNIASMDAATIAGGWDNRASGWRSTVGGGVWNWSTGHWGTVSGGQANVASADNATVSGGANDTASAAYAVVSGGNHNKATAQDANVGGGAYNTASGWGSTVSGGDENLASGIQAVVGGGARDSARGDQSTVAGGQYNVALAQFGTVGGGGSNRSVGASATVGGGFHNYADSDYTFVGGGKWNEAVNTYATVAGGDSNIARGFYSTVPGGGYNEARGDFSFAAGRSAIADHNNSFVWASSGMTSTATNQFLIDASGGVGVSTNAPNSRLHVGGSFATGLVSTSGNYTLGIANHTLLCTSISAAQTVTLPTAVGISGREYTIKRTGTWTVNINTTSSQSIDGVVGPPAKQLTVQYQYVTVVSNGANWLIVGGN